MAPLGISEASSRFSKVQAITFSKRVPFAKHSLALCVCVCVFACTGACVCLLLVCTLAYSHLLDRLC